MKTYVKTLSLLPALIAGLGLIPAGRVMANNFTVLHNFTWGSDGVWPAGRLVANSSGNTLYGTANFAGSGGNGTVFAVNTDGTGFTILHAFNGITSWTNGTQPRAGLILSGNTLYGTAWQGGIAGGNGTVFALNTDGTGFKLLHSFTLPSGVLRTNSDGAKPVAGLILSSNSNTLYGTAEYGGSWGEGTVFALNTDGTGFTNLHSFTARFDPYYTNSDGANPNAELTLSGNTLYGTAIGGGSLGRGTVFKVNTDGTGFTTLHHFTRADYNPDTNPSSTNSDGVYPYGGLLLAGNTLYGTAQLGGGFGQGTVFALNTDGTDFTILHSFAGSDGGRPAAGLILSGNTLYGTTGYTVFAVHTNGTGFTNLHNFDTDSDGTRLAGVVLSGNSLYGAARNGGDNDNGTVFSLSFAPQLAMIRSGANVILTWPTNVAGFDHTGFTLQSTTDLVSPAVWITNSPAPVVVNGQNAVTNPISGTQKFYRLSQ